MDGEKRKECSRLMRSERLDLKHGSWMRPNGNSPELIHGQLGELALDAVVQAASVLQLVYSVIDCGVY